MKSRKLEKASQISTFTTLSLRNDVIIKYVKYKLNTLFYTACAKEVVVFEVYIKSLKRFRIIKEFVKDISWFWAQFLVCLEILISCTRGHKLGSTGLIKFSRSV